MKRPFFVGIAGGTGAGKTTIARTLSSAMPAGFSSVIEHDSYYRQRDDLTNEERRELNYDHPESLDNELLLEHLAQLKSGRSVAVPMYDFTSHRRRTETRTVEAARVVIVEGILTFVDARIRASLDLRIFVDTDPDIRIMRRIRRDIEMRGRTFASVRKQYYETVRPMHEQFVQPSKRWADLVVPEGGENRVGLNTIVANLLSSLARD